MKKLLASILLLVYFTVSTGFVVSIHYCMNKVDSIELGDNHDEECGKCGMHIEKSRGCCKDDVKVVKMQMDQTTAKTFVADFSIPLPTAITGEFILAPYKNCISAGYPLAHGPPLSKQDTYLQNCVFRL